MFAETCLSGVHPIMDIRDSKLLLLIDQLAGQFWDNATHKEQ